MPAGELDGGRVFLGLFGRGAQARMGAGEQRLWLTPAPAVSPLHVCVLVFTPLAPPSIPPLLPAVTLLLLGLTGFTNSLALFWLILVVTLQRGPVTPCDNEVSPVTDGATRAAGIAALLLPFLVLLPWPEALSLGAGGLPDLPPTF